MFFDSIRWRLVASYVLIAIITVTVVGVLTLTLLGELIHTQSQAQLQANAEAIALQSAQLLQPYPRLDALIEMTRTLSFLSNIHIQILDPDQNVVIDSGTPEQHNAVVWVQPDANAQDDSPPMIIPLSPWDSNTPGETVWQRKYMTDRRALIIHIDSGPWGRGVIFEQIQSNEWSAPPAPTQAANAQQPTAVVPARLVSAVRVPIGSPDQPLGYVQVSDPRPAGAQALQSMRQALLLAGLGAALVAALAGLAVSHSLTAPLKTLASSATQMSGGNLAVRAPIRGAGEIKRLARQFNTMAERLQASFMALSAERDALRRFIADASHELRTPITAMRSFVELLQGPAAQDSAAREEFLAECQSQIQRMEWITANLLDLSRLDAGLVALDWQAVEVNDLLASSAAPFQRQAQEKAIQLAVQPSVSGGSLTCDAARIEMALSNLIENALKYTPSGGKITLSAGEDAQGVWLQVRDNGAGIASDDLPHIFERFYRGQAPGGKQPAGSGLGLAIVYSLVQAHHGQVQVESQPGEGSSFTIHLPAGSLALPAQDESA